MEPDFKAFARAWVANDPRTRQGDAARNDALVARLAAALEHRRSDLDALDPPDGSLVVSVDRSRLDAATGLDLDALAQLCDYLQEAAEDGDTGL